MSTGALCGTITRVRRALPLGPTIDPTYVEEHRARSTASALVHSVQTLCSPRGSTAVLMLGSLVA